MDGGPPTYERIDVANVTPRTAPPYGTINFIQRNSQFVLTAQDGSGKLLIGPLGVNYYPDGRPDHTVIFLRRWDMPAYRGRSRSRNSSSESEG